jgi:cell division protein FtsW
MDNIKIWIDNNIQGDKYIWGIVIGLNLMSMIFVLSAVGGDAYEFDAIKKVTKHFFHIMAGLVVMWALHKMNYRLFANLSFWAVLISIFFLIWAKFFGVKMNEASRWVNLGFVTFQPSDMAKVSLITFLVTLLGRSQHKKDEFVNTLKITGWCVFVCGLIAASNASNGIILLINCFVVMYIGLVPKKHLAILIVVGSLFIAAGIVFGKERLETVLTRVDVFHKSWTEGKVPHQVAEGYKAIALGAPMGVGPGNSHQRNTLPYCYADFIFPIIIEEYGMLGGLLVIAMFLALLYRGLKGVQNSNRAFGGLLAAGLTASIVLQAFFNMAVTVELFPTTGLTLPFLSMGGTSILFSCATVGIILSASRGEQVSNV